MTLTLWINTTLKRGPENAKVYNSKVDTLFPTPLAVWKHIGALNYYDYTPIRFKEGKREGTGFLSSGCFSFDYDHIFPTSLLDHDPQEARGKIEQALSLQGSDLAYLAVPSHRLNGMHIILPLARDITDSGAYGALFRYIVSTHPALDQQVKDTGRFFFASALPDDVFRRYTLFRKGEALSVSILTAQAEQKGREEAKKRARALRAKKANFDGCFKFREPFDWSRWDFTEGHRNSSLYRAACSLLGQKRANARQEWESVAEGVGLDDKEIAGIWASAVRFTGWEG